MRRQRTPSLSSSGQRPSSLQVVIQHGIASFSQAVLKVGTRGNDRDKPGISAEMTTTTPFVAVTGSQPPYVYDLPWLLSLPSGFEFRFRYHQVWVSDDVLSKIKSTPNDALHRPVVIVFHSQEQKRLLPVRVGSVIAVDKLGPLVFLRFAVGPFVHVSPTVVLAKAGSAEREAESNRLSDQARRLLALEKHDLATPLPKGSYLSLAARNEDIGWSKVNDSDVRDVSASWAAVAALLMSEQRLFQIPMFHLLGFQEFDGVFRSPTDLGRLPSIGGLTGSTPRRRGFRLVDGKRYRLRILEWCETIKGATRLAKLAVEAAPQVLSLEGSSNMVVGGYDVLEFMFKAARPGYTELSVGVAALDDDAPPVKGTQERQPEKGQLEVGLPESRTWPMIYTAQVPVEVRHNWWRVAALVSSGGLGAFIYTSLHGKLWELAGLLILFTTLGTLLEGFLKFSSEVRDFPQGGPRPRGK